MKTPERIADGFIDQILITVPPGIQEDLAVLPLTERLYLTIAGYFPHAAHHYRNRPQGCEDMILIFCAQGSGWCRLKQRTIEIPSHHFIIIPAYQGHTYGAAESDPWSIYWAHMRGPAGSVYLGHFPSSVPVAQVATSINQQVEQLFTHMLDRLQQDFTLNTFIHTSAILGHILSLLFFGNPAFSDPIKTIHLEAVESSIQYMRHHLNQSLSLAQIARQAQLSPPHFSRLFRQKTGSSPMDYFLRLRMQRACQFLLTSSVSIQQIARQLGYHDPYYFSRSFRKKMGVSPRQYRWNHG